MLRGFVCFLIMMAYAVRADAKSVFADVDLSFVRIGLSVDPGVRFVSGNVTQCFSLKNRYSKNLPLLLLLNDSLKVTSVNNAGKDLLYSHKGDSLIIFPNDAWELYDSVNVVYSGVPESTGFGSVVFHKHEGVPIFWTMSCPYGAKDWFPCRQILTDKYDSVQVIVECPRQYRGVSNGAIVSDTVVGGKRITNWFHRHPCAFYLIAIAVTNYRDYQEYIKLSNGDSVLFVNYVFPERYEQCRKRTSKLIPAFKALCDTFGIYPFADEKYGQAQFLWSGGMEHQTITFISEFREHLMIHELAHQWFGNTITCSSWHDIWINEGFAEYCEGLTREMGVGHNSDPVGWRKSKIYSASANPYGSIYVNDTTQLWEIFDSRLTYDKGAMLLHMLRTEIGDNTFFNCLKYFVKYSRHRFGNASAQDFFTFVNEFSGQDYQWFFDQWYYGRGTPVYRVLWDQSDDKLLNIKIEQGRTDSTMGFFRAKIPLMICGSAGESVFVRVNNTIENQFFTIDPGFDVSAVVFDPYGDLLSWGSVTKEEKFTTDSGLKIRNRKGKLLVSVSNSEAFSNYFIKSFKLSTMASGKIGNDGRATIDLRRIPSGEYYIALEGDGYCAKKVSVGKKEGRK